jgi:hypothetical protein
VPATGLRATLYSTSEQWDTMHTCRSRAPCVLHAHRTALYRTPSRTLTTLRHLPLHAEAPLDETFTVLCTGGVGQAARDGRASAVHTGVGFRVYVGYGGRCTVPGTARMLLRFAGTEPGIALGATNNADSDGAVSCGTLFLSHAVYPVRTNIVHSIFMFLARKWGVYSAQ